MAIQGSCLCGTLRYEVDTPLAAMVHCHCSRCRKQNGAPFTTYATAPAQALRWHQGEETVVAGHADSGGARRFCGTCGAPVPGLIEHGLALIPVGTLEGDPGLRPQAHLFVGSKAAWHEIGDALPRHDQYPPEFGDVPVLPDPPARAPASEGHFGGSCRCGDVTFELRKPVAMFQCHCSRCRKARGSAHGANLFCAIEDFRWLSGEAQVVDYKLPEARFYGVAFCGRCGASVPRISVGRGMVVVPVSALDSDTGLRPAAHIYTASKAPWFDITDTIPQHPEGPPFLTPPAR